MDRHGKTRGSLTHRVYTVWNMFDDFRVQAVELDVGDDVWLNTDADMQLLDFAEGCVPCVLTMSRRGDFL